MQILARAVGRRKEAVAQVQIVRGTGQFIINNKPAHEYLQNDSCSLLSVKAPFEIFMGVINASKGKESVKNAGETSTHNSKSVNKLSSSDIFVAENALTLNGSNSNGDVQETERSNSVLNDPISQLNSDWSNISEGALKGLALEQIDTIVKVKGGGLMGQSEAIRLGISRAVCLLELSETNLNKEQKANESRKYVASQMSEALENIPANELHASEVAGTEPHSLTGLRKQLKAKGYLTQDARVKERRKYGLKKARKASQYHKR